jgi:hypothetical protein
VPLCLLGSGAGGADPEPSGALALDLAAIGHGSRRRRAQVGGPFARRCAR